MNENVRAHIIALLKNYHIQPGQVFPHCLIEGAVIPGYVIVSDFRKDSNGNSSPEIFIYTWNELKLWYDRAGEHEEEIGGTPEHDDGTWDLIDSFRATAEIPYFHSMFHYPRERRKKTTNESK